MGLATYGKIRLGVGLVLAGVAGAASPQILPRAVLEE